MIYDCVQNIINYPKYIGLVAIISFVVSYVMLNVKFPFLPKDKGREYAVNGEASKGKIRGVGLIMVFCLLLCSSVFVNLNIELVIYGFLVLLEMLSGFFDDASAIPWSDYKKGLIDFIVAAGISVTFVYNNSTDIVLLGKIYAINPTIYCCLAIILVWISINVTNCSDGVDGLCASLSIVILLTTVSIYRVDFNQESLITCTIVVSILFSYLVFNSSPSLILMGDAGSRFIGLLIALFFMKSHHPLSYMILAIVLIIDGIVGLVKVFFKRFLKISVLKSIRTPIHDEFRTNHGWSDTQVVNRFTIMQLFIAVIAYLLNI